MSHNVRVELGARSYEIIVGERLLAKADSYIAPLLASQKVIIISDKNVARFYLHRLTGALENAAITYRSVIVDAGEQSKSMASFASTIEDVLALAPDRHTTLIALGGGVVGDLCGFIASVCVRGLPFIQIPTSLLAQVDSSVGGKTAINSAHGKNLIGAFYQPKLVLADVETLATLPERERLAGYAEIVKYGLIRDAALFDWLEQNGAAMLKGDNALYTQAIVQCCQAKAAIVAEDERESGVRALLNFGHTFGHALEAETGFGDRLLHGEAVAIGMIMALEASVRMNHCDAHTLDRVRRHFKEVGLPCSPLDIQPDWNVDALMAHFDHDKKTLDGKLTFILAKDIGQAFIAKNVQRDEIKPIVAQLCEAAS